MVAAVGALLLLAAAATFLVVSWDVVPVPARVAIVGAATAAAIGGGAVLRRRLPAVGAVVFHLGVVLVPVDVLGLALQLDASRGATWVAVGIATMVALPTAGSLGRAPLLGGLGLLGVPLAATGLADLGLAAAPVLVALAAVAVAVGGWPGSSRTVRGAAGPLLAATAVVGPVIVTATAAVLSWTSASPLRTAIATGWRPERWEDAAVAGLVGVVTVAGVALRRRARRLAATVPVLAAFAVTGVLLAGDAPRLAVLLPWPLLFVATETVAWLLADDRLLRRPAAAAAAVAETLAALTLPATLAVVAFGSELSADPELAVAVGLTAVAWLLAAVRTHPDGAVAALCAGAAAVAVAGAASLAAPGLPVGAVVLLAAAAATLAFRADGVAGATASAVGVVLGAAAVVAVANLPVPPSHLLGGHAATVAALAPGMVAAIGAVLAVVRLAAHLRVPGVDPALPVMALVPVHLLAALAATAEAVRVSGDAVGGVVLVALLLIGGAVLERVPAVADTLRGLAALVAGVVVVSTTSGGDALGDAVVALPAATLVAVVLAVETWRTGRERLALLAGPVAVRATAGGVWLATDSRVTTGLVLVGVALAAAATAGVAARWRIAGAVTATIAGVAGVALLAVSAHAVAITLVGLGVVTAAAGVASRVPVVAHTGAITAVTGLWWLLSLERVTALDLWAAPVALYLWLAMVPARRAGRVSSWVADVPPLLLVVVPALLERLAGGPGWHALLAGALGVAAVAGGGSGRHGGPLIVGTATVVTVVAVETFAVVAAVPTWAWLTLGGVTLLGTAVLIERTGGAPAATARRVRDVLAERFD